MPPRKGRRGGAKKVVEEVSDGENETFVPKITAQKKKVTYNSTFADFADSDDDSLNSVVVKQSKGANEGEDGKYDKVIDLGAFESDDEKDIARDTYDPTYWDKKKETELQQVEQRSKSWGKNVSTYYNADTMDYEIESDDDIAATEEKEAIRLQKLKNVEFQDEDFGLSDIIAPIMQKKEAKMSLQKLAKTAMTTEQKIQLILSDSPELLSILDGFSVNTEVLQNEVQPLMEQAKKEGRATDNVEGYSFLQTKEQLLLAYTVNVIFYLVLKSEGVSVQSHPVIERIHFISTLLDKMNILTDKMFDVIREAVDYKSWKGEQDEFAEKYEEYLTLKKDVEASNAEFENASQDDSFDDDMFDDEDSEEEIEAPSKSKTKASKKIFSLEELGIEVGQDDIYASMLAPSKATKATKAAKTEAIQSVTSMARKRKIDESLEDDMETYGDYSELSGVRAVDRALEDRFDMVKAALHRPVVTKPTDRLQEMFHGVDDDDDDLGLDMDLEDDDDMVDKNLFAKESEKASKKRKTKSLTKSIYVGPNVNLVDSEGRRAASKKVVANRGLVRYRNRLDSNPRVRRRRQHEKAMAKRRTVIREFTGAKGDDYSGERAINKNIIRSRKLN